MKRWSVIVHATEEIEVDAETEDQAKDLAAEESCFSSVDYCEANEIE